MRSEWAESNTPTSTPAADDRTEADMSNEQIPIRQHCRSGAPHGSHFFTVADRHAPIGGRFVQCAGTEVSP